MAWSHTISQRWASLLTNSYVDNKYLPAVGFQYRIYLTVGITAGMAFNGQIEFIVWLQTSENMQSKDSPFAQKVVLKYSIAYLQMLFTWYIWKEEITNRPSFLGFNPEGGAYTTYGAAEVGINDPASGYGYGISSGEIGWIETEWQSPMYKIAVPTGSRFRIARNTATRAVTVQPAVVTIRLDTGGGERTVIAADNERRIYTAVPSADQVSLRRRENTTVAFIQRSITNTSNKKRSSAVVTNRDGDVPFWYADKDGIRFAVSRNGGGTINE
jgi:hypothetical protein